MSHHPVCLFASITARALVLRPHLWASVLVLAVSPAPAQTRDADSSAADAFRQAQEREALRRSRLEVQPDVRLNTPLQAATAPRLPVDEDPCFPIQAVDMALVTPAQLPLAPALAALNGLAGDDAPQGKCLGARGVALLLERAQNALIEMGFVTSRVLAPPQDLSSGRLLLHVLPGRIAHIRLARPDERATLRPALPMAEGDVLQLRDVEQALENLKRVPTAEADIQIEPGQEPGTSDLVVSWSQANPWRLSLTADDSGSESSGKYQGSATLSYDHAFTLNDLLYVTLARDLGGGDPGRRGTRGVTTHYSVPFGYWLLGLNASRNRYFQTVAGATQDYVYSGVSHQQDIQLTHWFHRDGVSKSSWSIKAFARQSENHIDDTEVEVQRRRVGGYELGLQHRTQWGAVQAEGNVSYRRGTRAFGANVAPEELFGEGTHQFGLVVGDAQVSAPFQLGDQRWHYQGNWRWQHNRTALTPQDRFSIGGRYTVRGFDGRSSLTGDRGWLVRNEVSTDLAEQQIYLALDHGRVAGPSALSLVGQRLTGWALGLRSHLGPLNFDLFIGAPVRKPQGFRTANTIYGVSVSAQF
ncbi:ShlB/FhaC/HecB family hemolysin secretion/activation protein [Hydrogenophaga sp.]|uniref:ShlB/FhaC/HecB family hemolysin secretion/activation protein n=1 Tax=Hydrogenophaga sp. TaxID=1904254 RepID=UPI00391CA207